MDPFSSKLGGLAPWLALGALLVVVGGLLVRRAVRRREALRACRFSLVEVGVRPTGLATATLRLVFRVQNPGRERAVVDALDYRVSLGERPVTQGAVVEPLSVPPGGIGTVPLTVELDALNLGAALIGALLSGERRLRVVGEAHVRLLGSWHLHLPLEDELRIGGKVDGGRA